MSLATASVLVLSALAVGACANNSSTATRTSNATGSALPRESLLLNPAHPEWKKPAPPVSHLRFETTKGVFTLELIRANGPIGADRLYNLARLGYYNDTRFHRVNKNYIAQFGLHGNPAVNDAWKEQYLTDDAPRSHNVRGTFAFSFKAIKDTRNTQIYINLADNPKNDVEAFTVLGSVIEGMSVLDSLYSGYGENSGSGVRQGKQGPLASGGNAFIDREFPLLDRIRRVTVVIVKKSAKNQGIHQGFRPHNCVSEVANGGQL